MNRQTNPSRKATYGIDAPTLLPWAAVVCVANGVLAYASRAVGPLIGALVALFCVGCGLYASTRGKFLIWANVLDGLQLKGGERILDLGCGRGAVLMATARRLTTGRAVGVDIWDRSDQSGNAAGATRRNADAENVAGRVMLLTGDMTALPLRSESFDLVTSNVAIHNIKGRPARQKAIDEAVRVLRPGGRVTLADLSGTRSYVTRLAALGMIDVKRRNLGWRMWWGGPWMPTYLVTATKPAGSLLNRRADANPPRSRSVSP
jgi:ubiquinone/menaquinone biosynthesis C-methylase UbiE